MAWRVFDHPDNDPDTDPDRAWGLAEDRPVEEHEAETRRPALDSQQPLVPRSVVGPAEREHTGGVVPLLPAVLVVNVQNRQRSATRDQAAAVVTVEHTTLDLGGDRPRHPVVFFAQVVDLSPAASVLHRASADRDGSLPSLARRRVASPTLVDHQALHRRLPPLRTRAAFHELEDGLPVWDDSDLLLDPGDELIELGDGLLWKREHPSARGRLPLSLGPQIVRGRRLSLSQPLRLRVRSRDLGELTRLGPVEPPRVKGLSDLGQAIGGLGDPDRLACLALAYPVLVPRVGEDARVAKVAKEFFALHRCEGVRDLREILVTRHEQGVQACAH